MQSMIGIEGCSGSSPISRQEAARSAHAFADDRNLIDLCRAGDPDAWNTLIQRYEKSVYRFAYTLCRNYDDAADIAGNVFLRLYENIHTFRHESNFTSWLFRIVRNVYVDTCIRAPHRSHLSLDDGADRNGDFVPHEVADNSPSPEDRMIDTEKHTI